MSFKNYHPDHSIMIKGEAVSCSCGFKRTGQIRNAGEHIAGQHYAATRGHQAGQFKATCRLDVEKPYGTLTDEELALMEYSNIKSRWDRKLNLEVVPIPCAFETEDRAEYLAHMALHGKKPQRGPKQLKQGQGMWKRPSLKDDGIPWPDSDKRTVTCECGLVVDGSFSTPYVCPGCGDILGQAVA